MEICCRVTGKVVRSEVISGTSDRGPYRFTSCTVLVADQGLATVTVRDGSEIDTNNGSPFDVVAVVRLARNGALRCQAVAPWPVGF